MQVNFSKDEILTLRRAVNALRTRQELNCIGCSEKQRELFIETIEKLNTLDNKLCLIKPTQTDSVSS